MQNLLEDFKQLLTNDERLVSKHGELLKNLIVELGLKLDPDLLRLLLSHDRIRRHFFAEVDDILVFDKDKFLQFVSNKAFLPDSYTAFKNKIGLSDDGGETYLSRSREVALVWPYKDCVLEGGQTKEDARRNEIFWNTTLAPDDIDRLLDPKVLTNFKRYTADGEEPVSDFRRDENGVISENLIMRGNNLLALCILKTQFRGKVKLIYIDPPYNRNENNFYNDSFRHSSWLTFMKNRLEMARQLLSQQGCIFISIDDTEQAYLKVLCDEIFGRDNFLASIAYERSGVSGLGQGGRFLVNTHESILCYARSKPHFIPVDLSGEGEFSKKDMRRYNKYLIRVGNGTEHVRFIAPSTKEEVVIYHHPAYEIGTISLKKFDERYDEIYDEYLKRFEDIFRNTSIQEENKFQNRILGHCQDGFYSARYLVSRGKNKGQVITVYYLNGRVFAWLKNSAKISNGRIVKTNKLSDFWDHGSIPKADLANEGGVKLRRGKKPENLLKRLIIMVTEPGDLVLDFYNGSGTTCAVAHKMGRQYIGVEQLDYGENDSVVRLHNVIKGDKTGISKAVNWQGGDDFVYCELLQWNERYVQRIQAAKSTAESLALWQEMQALAFLGYRVDITAVNEQAQDFADLTLDEQRRFLLETLDYNALYVNLSEIDDADYAISEEDKRLNVQFYGREA